MNDFDLSPYLIQGVSLFERKRVRRWKFIPLFYKIIYIPITHPTYTFFNEDITVTRFISRIDGNPCFNPPPASKYIYTVDVC
jgi:hypothetical protein